MVASGACVRSHRCIRRVACRGGGTPRAPRVTVQEEARGGVSGQSVDEKRTKK